MRLLVDANVRSEPTRRSPDAAVLSWLRTHEADLAVNPVVLGELIAATALQYGLAVATRNVRDFEAAGAEVMNPFRSPGP